MVYFKCVDGGYIRSVGKSEKPVFDVITPEEYAEIKAIMAQKPTPPEGCGYRLKTDLTWELYELPEYEQPEVDADPELTAEEALEIIVGGSV